MIATCRATGQQVEVVVAATSSEPD